MHTDKEALTQKHHGSSHSGWNLTLTCPCPQCPQPSTLLGVSQVLISASSVRIYSLLQDSHRMSHLCSLSLNIRLRQRHSFFLCRGKRPPPWFPLTADAASISNQEQRPKEAPYPGKGKAVFQLSNWGKASLKKFLCEQVPTCT